VNDAKIGRRDFIGLGMLGFVLSLFPREVLAATRSLLTIERSLSLHNTHTGESLNTVYWAHGDYLSGALDDLNYILRDHRTEEIKPIDTQLLDLLHALSETLCTRQPFHVISGYRSQATNDFLRTRGRGVARNSLHIQGKAMDIRLPGCDLSVLRESAMGLRGGGVGYYPRSGFVHVDIGRLKYWSF